jgi:hypothetical protein
MARENRNEQKVQQLLKELTDRGEHEENEGILQCMARLRVGTSSKYRRLVDAEFKLLRDCLRVALDQEYDVEG